MLPHWHTRLIFYSLAITVALGGASTSPKVVDLGYASYQSTLSPAEGVTSFLGIRYAAPPTSQFRWKAPRPPAPIAGLQNATSQPRQCFQSGSLTGSAGTAVFNRFRANDSLSGADKFARRDKRDTDGLSDEDCLFLNVHTPTAATERSLLPVIVYIHGGGYDAGNISLYPTEDFVTLSHLGVVAVSIQYRLGVLGFLAGEDVKQGGDLDAGLLDQNFALQWVQQHIAAFGGNPQKVTIWGQSAGAGSMLQHIVAHGGNTNPPLFRAALANSPFFPFQYEYNDPIPETLYTTVVSYVNCNHAPDTLKCLRSTEASTLIDADTAIGLASFMGTYTFLFPRLTEREIQAAFSLYSNIDGVTSDSDQATKVMAESIFVCPAYWMVRAFGRRGWKGEFAVPPGLHTEDLSYEFSTFAIPPTYTNPAFLEAYQQSFLSTVISLDPNVHSDSSILPAWHGWSEGATEMLFNKTDSGAPVVKSIDTDPKTLERCT
ncbi:alpha/beta-hydrolase [Mycena galericulata]|nr:alpha/beta-hydrolase [Mycena galericulata]